jgi:nitrous oxidase accessory protein
VEFSEEAYYVKMTCTAGNIVLSILLFLLVNPSVGTAKDIIVCENCETKSLASAIAISNNGDRIMLQSGTYIEHDLFINNQISIIGEGSPVIDVNFKGAGITINEANVTIKGLTIKNIDVNYLSDLSGVRVEYADNCIIEDNIFDNTFFAIYVAGSKNCKIRGNTISGLAKTESSSGNGIHLWKCSEIQAADNRISGHRDGIYLEFVSSSVISGNYSKENLRYGLHFMFSDGNTYSSNTFENNGAGVAVMYSKNISMKRNTFKNNWGDASYGILLKELYDGVIDQNLFLKNTTGIHIEGSNRIEMINNDFIENGWAMNVLGNCYDNKIIGNDFINNTFDVSSNSSKNNNYYSGNYWDKYKGYDINRNGIGDVPYRPVSLFSMILQKSPESIVMLRSVIVDLLDAVERIVPSIIPETLIDEQPRISNSGHDKDNRPS